MLLSDTAGDSGEFAYLLDLAARRTAGRILAKATSLQVGSHRVDGFPQAVDAHYLAQAGNILPTLVPQLINTRTLAHEQSQEIAVLRGQVLDLERQLVKAQADDQETQAILRKARRLIRRLQKKVATKPEVKVKFESREIIRYRVSVVPAAWFGPDGHLYELTYLPDQLEDSPFLAEYSTVSSADPSSC